jgi:Domain of unknown function (DUF3883)
MNKPSGVKHDNYEVLNLVGYGLAKFEKDLVAAMQFQTKTALYGELLQRGVANTVGTLKNRQDLFNPLVRGGKTGWWQNGDRYLHRKILLDSLFGGLDASGYAAMLQSYLHAYFPLPTETATTLPPILTSRFRQMQETGREAELIFINAYPSYGQFASGVLEDARLFGDGYDFQITLPNSFVLVDVKGVRATEGSVRLTEKEYARAGEYKHAYCLAVVSNLIKVPRIRLIFDPLSSIILTRQSIQTEQFFYTSPKLQW